jgi:hypothetical protein
MDTSGVYNSDIEMIMDFLKLSIISNDTSQSNERRSEALNLQKAMLEVLPVAQSNRVSQIYSKMHEIYRLNRDGTSVKALDSEIERLRQLNRGEATMNTQEEDSPFNRVRQLQQLQQMHQMRQMPQMRQIPQVQQPNVQHVQNVMTVNGVKPYQGPPMGSSVRPMQVQPPQSVVRTISPVPNRGVQINTVRTMSPVPAVHNHPMNPVGTSMVHMTKASTPSIFRPGSPVPMPSEDKPNRFVIMVGDSAHRENERVMPIWNAYKNSINTIPGGSPVVIKQFDASQQQEAVNSLRDKLNLDNLTGPTVYRVDLSSGQPQVMRFLRPVTLDNLRDFSSFE